MKVLIISTGIIPVPCKYGAAIEMHTYNLANTLAERGCSVHYVTDITSDAKLHRRIKIHKVYSPPMTFPVRFPLWILTHIIGGFLAFRAALFALIRNRFSFDIIHVHDEVSGALFSLLKRLIKLNMPIVFTLHNPISQASGVKTTVDQQVRKVIFLLTDKMLIEHCDHVIALSTRIKEILTSWLGCPSKKVTVIPHSVDPYVFKPEIPNTGVITAKYGIKRKYIVFVGRLDKRKGVDILLEAFSHLDADEWSCVVVGDGPERGKLVKLARQLGVSEHVIFTGRVPLQDLPALYSEAELFVLPTFAEATAMVILEALASGLPVITTKLPGVEDVVMDGYNGVTCNRDSEELCRCISSLIRNELLRRRMGNNARLIAIEKHGPQQIAIKTMEVYERAMKGNWS